MKDPNFKTLLKSYGEMYFDYCDKLQVDLRRKTDDELREIIKATDELTETNCWWATYQVAPAVKLYARDILHLREKEKSQGGEAQ